MLKIKCWEWRAPCFENVTVTRRLWINGVETTLPLRVVFFFSLSRCRAYRLYYYLLVIYARGTRLLTGWF